MTSQHDLTLTLRFTDLQSNETQDDVIHHVALTNETDADFPIVHVFTAASSYAIGNYVDFFYLFLANSVYVTMCVC